MRVTWATQRVSGGWYPLFGQNHTESVLRHDSKLFLLCYLRHARMYEDISIAALLKAPLDLIFNNFFCQSGKHLQSLPLHLIPNENGVLSLVSVGRVNFFEKPNRVVWHPCSPAARLLTVSIYCQALFSAEKAVFSGNIHMLLPSSKCSSCAVRYSMYRLGLKQ